MEFALNLTDSITCINVWGTVPRKVVEVKISEYHVGRIWKLLVIKIILEDEKTKTQPIFACTTVERKDDYILTTLNVGETLQGQQYHST